MSVEDDYGYTSSFQAEIDTMRVREAEGRRREAERRSELRQARDAKEAAAVEERRLEVVAIRDVLLNARAAAKFGLDHTRARTRSMRFSDGSLDGWVLLAGPVNETYMVSPAATERVAEGVGPGVSWVWRNRPATYAIRQTATEELVLETGGNLYHLKHRLIADIPIGLLHPHTALEGSHTLRDTRFDWPVTAVRSALLKFVTRPDPAVPRLMGCRG